MAKTDDKRWQDWRGDRRRPLRPSRKCSDCGARFMPQIRGQATCPPCAQIAAAIEREELERKELRAVGQRTQHPDVTTAESPNYGRRAAGAVTNKTGVLKPQSRTKRGRAKAGGRSPLKAVEHVIRRKLREKWSTRKIAKFLGRPHREVKAVVGEIEGAHRDPEAV